jgi:hypothetical protein
MRDKRGKSARPPLSALFALTAHPRWHAEKRVQDRALPIYAAHAGMAHLFGGEA